MPPRAEHHDRPLVLEVERFEQAPAGAERVLLRIDGRYGDRPGTRVLDAMLFVDDGLAVHRHAPVSEGAPDVDSWLWRAAFDVPTAYLTDERTRFALESQPGCLVELPHPDELLSARGAVPITARAAHVARRYAVAIAVMLTVAVTPGGMPASARTEILRVHNPDGSVVYMTRDGQTVGQLPADAVVIDQPAAPEPAAPQPAAPQPAATQPAPPAKWDDKKADGGVTGQADATPKKKPAPNVRPEKKQRPRSNHSHRQPEQQADQPTSYAPQHTTSPAPKTRKHRRHHAHHTHHSAAPEQTVAHAPVTGGQSLQQMPALLATPGNDGVKLQSLDRVGGSGHGAHSGRDVQTGTLPGKDLAALNELSGTGHTTAPPPTAIPTVDTAPPLVPIGPQTEPQSSDGRKQHRTRDHRHAPQPRPEPKKPAKPAEPKAPTHHSDGSPTASNPTFMDALPGPAAPGAVPDFVISKFRVPPFLLPVYQAAGIQYGIRWEVLAAINEIETDYGRNLNVSSAGALGWMQFMPSTWEMYGTDANHDKKKDPFNPVDAIFAAARYLKAAGGDKDIRRAVFAYNHAGWYVDSVMLRARLIAGYPPDLIGSLTGLTEGRFPVAAHAKYAEAKGKRNIDIYTRKQAPVVAVNDGVVKKIGHTKSKGRYVVLQDVYGNQYTYSHLGSVAKLHPVPKHDAKAASKADVEAVGANDPKPKAAASAGSQRPGHVHERRRRTVKPPRHSKRHAVAPAAPKVVAVKKRFFAHPERPEAQKHGGFEQILDSQAKGFETYDSYFSRPLGLNSRNATLRRLKKGSHVLASTVLGRVGDRKGKKAAHLRFEIRPAGKGAPKIDPKPIVDGWKLLESTAIYRAKGRNALYGDGNFSIGEIMLLPKPLLAKRVLSDSRIDIYPGGREDIRTGQVDRRVLVVLEYLAESGLNPTVSCLKSGHSLMTASGNVSEHSSGNAVDISAINGTPILGHQDSGGVTEQAVRRLMLLQGTMQPHQIISLLDLGANTMSLPDHANHIHVGFHPLFGENKQLGREAMSVLEPRQWDDLVQRLGQIDNPTVPTKPSKYAIPDRKGDL